MFLSLVPFLFVCFLQENDYDLLEQRVSSEQWPIILQAFLSLISQIIVLHHHRVLILICKCLPLLCLIA